MSTSLGLAAHHDRKIVGPWVRQLLRRRAFRYDGSGEMVLAGIWLADRGDCWRWSAGDSRDSVAGFAADREQAKALADKALVDRGYLLIELPGGCQVGENV